MKLQDFDFRIWNNTNKHYEKMSNVDNYTILPALILNNNLSHAIFLNLYSKEGGETNTLNLSHIKENDNNIKEKLDIEIELWTGLYDKNGKKIYEGDILEWIDDFNRLQFLKVNISIKYGVEFIGDGVILDINYSKNAIIAGNIHEKFC